MFSKKITESVHEKQECARASLIVCDVIKQSMKFRVSVTNSRFKPGASNLEETSFAEHEF